MPDTPETCPACGADWRGGQTCEDHFHQMLFWEAEDQRRGVVHHLMVLSYQLQHPHRYSNAGLRYSVGLLVEFVEQGTPTEVVRARSRDSVDSGKRSWTVTARPGDAGAYANPVTWTVTAADVIARGADAYVESVREWARSIYDALRESGNL